MTALHAHVERLTCADEADRTNAAEDIGYLNVPDGVAPLVRRATVEPSVAVRSAIFQALTRIDGQTAIEGTVVLLGSDDPELRAQAVEVLRRKGTEVIPSLKRVMRDGDKDLRKLVLEVSSGLPIAEVEDLYTTGLSDPDPNVVITTVEILGTLRAQQFVGQVEALLDEDSHPMLLAACIEALADLGRPSSLAVIRRRFPNWMTLPDFWLVCCLKALATLGTTADFADVARLLRSRPPQLRAAILSALAGIGHRHHPLPADEELLDELRAIIESEAHAQCRCLALDVLGRWNSREDVCAFLVSSLSSTERLVRIGAAESIRAGRPELEPLLDTLARTELDDEVRQALLGR